MTTDKVRAYLAIIITVGTLFIAAVIALQEILTGQETNLEVLKNWSSLWSGILGVILGYYFAKKE